MTVLSIKSRSSSSLFSKVQRFAFPLVCGLFFSTQAFAAPQVLPISGILTDESGRGRDDTITLHLRLYSTLSGGM
ncbi:MAG: hypothetical protein GY822_01235 [Deltaproteobacteria bacterium]|nr:hypothetical protein [Deltaproteobacteria bacterium]